MPTERRVIPEQRPPSSSFWRVFPAVAEAERHAGRIKTADNIESFLAGHAIWKAEEKQRITRELDDSGYVPVRVPTFRSPAMHARHDAALRSTPLRNARGAAGRDPMRWGGA